MTRSSSEDFHRPVMAAEVVRNLLRDPDGVYLDLTVGGGGHMTAMSEKLSSTGRLYGVDRDSRAIERARKQLTEAPQVKQIVQGKFSEIKSIVQNWEDNRFDGILLDLGVSSAQIDHPERGFSFRFDGPLDMRMDSTEGISASEFLADVDKKELTKIIFKFGEERQAARIAASIVMEREKRGIITTGQLASIVSSIVRGPHRTKSLARVFQALRIYINKELEQLEKVLPAACDLLLPSGRIAVISYHSLEDRIVKQFLRKQSKPQCTCPPRLPVCQCNAVSKMKVITRKAIKASDEEIAGNSRARSASLRVGEML